MPSVASETNTYVVKHTFSRPAHPPPQADQAPSSPFDDLVDDASAPEQPAPANDTQTAAQTGPTKPAVKTTEATNTAAPPRPTDPNPTTQADVSVLSTDDDATGKINRDSKATGDGKETTKLADKIPTPGDDKPVDDSKPDATSVVVTDTMPVRADATVLTIDPIAAPDTTTAAKPAPATATLPPVPPPSLQDFLPIAAPEVTLVAGQKPKAKLPDGATSPTDADKSAEDVPLPNVTGPDAAIINAQSTIAKTADKDFVKTQVAQARGESQTETRRTDSVQLPASTDGNAPESTSQAPTDSVQPLALTVPTQNTSQASATNPPPPPQPMPQAALIPLSGMAVEIAGKALACKNRFEIRLDPPELGRIEVRLDVDHDGNVTSRLVVDRADTLDLLRRDASGLERALQDAGLKTADNGLQFSLRDQSTNQEPVFTGTDSAQLTVDDTASASTDLSQYNYYRTGRPGGLDIRI